MLLLTAFFSFLITTSQAADVFLTGSKTFEITDYSVVKNGVSTGNCIQSDPFTVGGYQWAIEFYPQGFNPSYSDFVSVIVRLLNPKNVVKAIQTHHFRDWNSTGWSTSTPVDSNLRTFSANGYTGWGYFDFMARSNFEVSNYLRNDTLVIKTNIWVVKDSSSFLMPPLSAAAGNLYSWWDQVFQTSDVSVENSKSG
ncbi:BTB/POZ and MATH domain-containing protein 2 [Rhynchospora pubera]|uniref:BTB/POZ and MATH domain-containing protein 2 n=1 Tax=Rhynchospora pubera TaxID=906938 RepID=A0AAV8H440_9POAL|nr:BTB/POZ and MATH domain-containing protein 2 [Rhynchospora pubera]KAJ4810023.1 BTB/POZ and MATH domain-containing protein 2 [Rhynchospora pubera]